ncbi:MAG: DUF1684 domain-containing protein [Cyclobacteriaceae bacterium]
MKVYISLLCILLLFACNDNTTNREIDEDYLERFREFTSGPPKGPRLFYLQIVALVELDPFSLNSFGTDTSNQHIIDVSGFPDMAGSIRFSGDSLFYISQEGLDVKTQDQSIVDDYWLEISPGGQSEKLIHDDFKWFVTDFGNRYFLRIQDTSSERVASFKGFERYEPVSEFILPAKVNRYDQPREVSVPTVFDFEEKTTFVGTVDFDYQGEKYSLQMEKGGFIMFSDGTSGDTTYGAGRYLRIRRPNEDGTTIIDFNYAFNPPCSFSDYTTCLFPPSSNRLPFKVLAGEKAQML